MDQRSVNPSQRLCFITNKTAKNGPTICQPKPTTLLYYKQNSKEWTNDLSTQANNFALLQTKQQTDHVHCNSYNGHKLIKFTKINQMQNSTKLARSESFYCFRLF